MIKLEDYDVRLLDRVSNKLSLKDELYDRVGDLEEQIEDIEQDRDDNYKPIPIEQQI